MNNDYSKIIKKTELQIHDVQTAVKILRDKMLLLEVVKRMERRDNGDVTSCACF